MLTHFIKPSDVKFHKIQFRDSQAVTLETDGWTWQHDSTFFKHHVANMPKKGKSA
jgi:hypothetical protein